MRTRQAAYRGLFDRTEDADELALVRRALQTGTPLGNTRYKMKIEGWFCTTRKTEEALLSHKNTLFIQITLPCNYLHTSTVALTNPIPDRFKSGFTQKFVQSAPAKVMIMF